MDFRCWFVAQGKIMRLHWTYCSRHAGSKITKWILFVHAGKSIQKKLKLKCWLTSFMEESSESELQV